jgi:REP element-mobilizing transposase RayT
MASAWHEPWPRKPTRICHGLNALPSSSSATVGDVTRPHRVQTPGYYHVTSRGNNGIDIYADDDDRLLFISFLQRVAERSEWELHAWCLMTNHFHLVLENRLPNLAAGMHRLNGNYARWFNERYERTGHLFGSRFKAKAIIDELQLSNTAEYVFDNPVRAGLCASRHQWPWLGGSFWRYPLAA